MCFSHPLEHLRRKSRRESAMIYTCKHLYCSLWVRYNLLSLPFLTSTLCYRYLLFCRYIILFVISYSLSPYSIYFLHCLISKSFYPLPIRPSCFYSYFNLPVLPHPLSSFPDPPFNFPPFQPLPIISLIHLHPHAYLIHVPD